MIEDRPLEECDLVMKGGVTSGIVYPGALIALSRRYRFRNVGGTSVGAIAAAIAAAAAELRRRRDGSTDISETMGPVQKELSKEGFVFGLFQPTPTMRPLFAIVLAATGRAGRARRLAGALARLLAGQWPFTLALVLAWAALLALALTLGPVGEVFAVALAVGSGVGMAAIAVLGAAGLLVRRVKRALEDEANGFGMCPGTGQGAGPGLTEWLDATIQSVAGVDPASPLTFADLKAEGIGLEVMTTDLSRAAPVRLPLDPNAASPYRFDRDDMARLFPSHVVAHMVARAGEPDRDGRLLLPTDDLPVLVAIRASLSFPILISAMRLFSSSDGREQWLSDGGITSNFPVHFFDAWLPRRPTFGLDLEPHAPVAQGAGAKPGVWMLRRGDAPRPRWVDVPGLGVFLRQVFDAMQNWRDQAQAELPGYRERVCHIRLDAEEGSLNLKMDGATLERLARRGDEAGELIVSTFPARWEEHRRQRHLLLMSLLQQGVEGLAEPYAALKLGRLVSPPEPGEPGPAPADADRVTEALIDMVARWREPPPADFSAATETRPSPTMRITSPT